VGLLAPGGITRHLEDLKNAVLRWLEHEDKQGGEEGTTEYDEDLLLHLALENEEVAEPEQPEALSWLRRMRRLNLPMFDGGLYNQPYLFQLELDTVIEAEIEHQNILAANLRTKLKAAEKNHDGPEQPL